ncbi:prolyl oligopeptidase family serine peptidase [Chitinophaga japonensis]
MAQKIVIDINTFDKWASISKDLKISNNGKYVWYTIANSSYTYFQRKLVIQSVATNWKLELNGARNASFTDDSRKVLFIQEKDSLCLLDLDSKYAKYIPSVVDFQLFKHEGDEWLAYRKKIPETQLVLRNMKNNEEQAFTNATEYLLSKNGTSLVFKQEKLIGNDTLQTLSWVNISKGHLGVPKVIDECKEILNFRFDVSGTQLAFLKREKRNGLEDRSIWYYKIGMDQAVPLINGSSQEIDGNLQVEGLSNFSIDGERMFFTLKKKDVLRAAPKGEQVDVWNYLDVKLQSQQLIEVAPSPGSYAAVIDVRNGRIIRLQNEDEEFRMISNDRNDDWALITYKKGHEVEAYWNRLSAPQYYLESVKTGKRKQIGVPFYNISPGGKYLVGDDGQGNIFTYEPATGVIHDVTKSIPVPRGDADEDVAGKLFDRGLIFGNYWQIDDEGMVVYDKYDVWQVDPNGVNVPINLTHGYGRKHSITFRFIEDEDKIYSKNEIFTLSAFDNDSKDNGFYTITLGKMQAPKYLTMGPYVFYVPSKPFIIDGIKPFKARDAESYVVYRCSVKESPNYFWTKDFKKFYPLSHVYPERNYAWLQSELVTFTTMDGRKEQGVLYKPENFDPHKKYPVIIHYYETKSDRLNQYVAPGFSNGDINIPYFVSLGYLVFTPDIHYTIGEVGQSAYNAIVGAGEYLVRQFWVDGKKIGLSGHSFGGYQTNYVIAHSNLFAAACSDVGVIDLISLYGHLRMGTTCQEFCEMAQLRIGASLWEKNDLYIKNSPIFQAGKVTTPVLLVSNKQDKNVPFTQGVKFFTALRRLGKRAWMLQYDNEGHNIFQRKNQKDISMRIMQFFDYYLKGAPIPEWMAAGVPARKKGTNPGLEYGISAP